MCITEIQINIEIIFIDINRNDQTTHNFFNQNTLDSQTIRANFQQQESYMQEQAIVAQLKMQLIQAWFRLLQKRPVNTKAKYKEAFEQYSSGILYIMNKISDCFKAKDYKSMFDNQKTSNAQEMQAIHIPESSSLLIAPSKQSIGPHFFDLSKSILRGTFFNFSLEKNCQHNQSGEMAQTDNSNIIFNIAPAPETTTGHRSSILYSTHLSLGQTRGNNKYSDTVYSEKNRYCTGAINKISFETERTSGLDFVIYGTKTYESFGCNRK